jgi:hypothetical protein
MCDFMWIVVALFHAYADGVSVLACRLFKCVKYGLRNI